MAARIDKRLAGLMSASGEHGAVTAAEMAAGAAVWDHTTHERFFEYYARESQSEEALQRFRRVRDAILRLRRDGARSRVLEVADIGCGAGTQSLVWAGSGHSVHALDINEPLLQLGRERAAAAAHAIDFRVGSATDLPWADQSMDVCIALELIEHVADWRSCVEEFARILRPGGVLFMTTTNRLCPIQEEFNLPLYSWYPSWLKRRCESMAATTRPALANYAKYPAVNWFTFYQLDAYLAARGFQSLDRFQIMDVGGKSPLARLLISSMRSIPVLRRLGQIFTPGTRILAVKAVGLGEPARAAGSLH
jgi:ubiquinone/menaquinone biosynthesis C-methylase UbiE